MGSTIEVDTECGKGSSFSFIVDFHIPEAQDDSTEHKNPALYADSIIHPSLNILVVEDESINQRILKKLLEKNNCSVTVVTNGKEALRVLDNRFFDVILMDIYMPEMDGYEAVKIIRRKEAKIGRYIPIIAMTAAIQKEDRDRYLKAGMDSCIAKPFGKDKLYSVITEAMKKQYKTTGVNLESLIERLDGDYKLLNDIINEVVNDKYEREFFGEMENYIKDKNLEKLSRHIHKFKGSISHFQIDSIDQILCEIRECCKSQDFPAIEKLSGKLKSEYERLKECLILWQTEK